MFWVIGKKGQLASSFSLEFEKKHQPYCVTSSGDVDVTSFSDIKNFLDSYPISTIVNTSAFTDVDRAEEEGEKAFSLNAEALDLLSEHSVKRGCKLIHFSTDYVFNGCLQRKYTETDKPHPINIYGLSKLEGERILLEKMPSALILRVSWLFSMFGQNFVKTMAKLIQEKKVLSVVSNQVGRPTYAQDVVDITLQMQNFSGIYHFANQEVFSRCDFVKNIKDALLDLGRDVFCEDIVPITSSQYVQKAKRPLRSVLDVTKIEKALNFRVPSYRKGLIETLQATEEVKL